MITSGSIIKIAPALLAAQKAMSNPSKQSKNPFFNSTYADLNSVRQACMPALHDNGITVLQVVVQVSGDRERTEKLDIKKQEQITTENTENYVETILLHESGEYIGSRTKIVCAKPSDPQAYGSAVSYARRYGLQAIVSLGADDDDGERAVGRVTSKAEKVTIKEAPVKDFHSFDDTGAIVEKPPTVKGGMTPAEQTKYNNFINANWDRLAPTFQKNILVKYGPASEVVVKKDAKEIMDLMRKLIETEPPAEKTNKVDIKAMRDEQNR